MEPSLFPEQLKDQSYEIICSNDEHLMEDLISALLSSQEPQRSQAYNFFLYCKDQYPLLLFIKLFYMFRYSSNMNTRVKSANVLTFCEVQNLWPKIPPQVQVKMKTEFLHCLKSEVSLPFSRILCGIVSGVAGEVYKSQDQWQELLEFLVQCLTMENQKFQEVALLVFANLSNDCRRVICNALSSRIYILRVGVLRGLASKNPDVKLAAFGSVISLLHLFSGSLWRDCFENLLQKTMSAVFDLLKGEKQAYVQKGLQEFINLVVEESQILRLHLCSLVSGMLKIAESRVIKDEAKNCAIQFLMTLVDTNDLAPAVKVLPSATMRGLFIIPMRMLIGIQDDVAWYEMRSVESENAGKTETYNYGIKCLKQMSVVLGGKNIVPIAFYFLPTYVDVQEWKRRHAGITMLGLISEECSHEMIFMEDYLQQTLNVILRSFQDSHPRVRYAAFSFMQLHTDLVGLLQILHHPRIVRAILAAVKQQQNPRVEEEAAAALLFFIRNVYQDCSTIFVGLDLLLLTLLPALLDKSRTTRFKTISLHIFNIVLKQWPAECFKYCVDYLPVLLNCCTSENSELRKAATLGIRICAQFGGAQFKPFIECALEKLGAVLPAPNRSCREDLEASDIAVCAIGIICEFHRDIVNATKLAPTWLSFLPLKDDLAEAKSAHELLCSVVERLDIPLLGNNYQNLNRIIFVFLEVISQGTNLASPETALRMKFFLKQMWLKFPQNILDPILLSLNSQQKQLLCSIS